VTQLVLAANTQAGPHGQRRRLPGVAQAARQASFATKTN